MHLTLVSADLLRVKMVLVSPTGPRSPQPHTSVTPVKTGPQSPHLTCCRSLLFGTWCPAPKNRQAHSSAWLSCSGALRPTQLWFEKLFVAVSPHVRPGSQPRAHGPQILSRKRGLGFAQLCGCGFYFTSEICAHSSSTEDPWAEGLTGKIPPTPIPPPRLQAESSLQV